MPDIAARSPGITPASLGRPLAWLVALTGCAITGGTDGAGIRSSSAPRNDPPLLRELFSRSTFGQQCINKTGKTECDLVLQAEIACADCYNPKIIDVPAFVGPERVSQVWLPYIEVMTSIMHGKPFLAGMQPLEEDEACFVRDHTSSAVLGPPYFENTRYCVRALRHQMYEVSPPLPGIRLRLTVEVSVTLNSHSPYREPEIDEFAKYHAALQEEYIESVKQSCGKLGGQSYNASCDLR